MCVLDLGIYGNDADEPVADDMVVDPIKDRHGRNILTVRDQNTFAEKMRQKLADGRHSPVADPPLQAGDRVLRDADRGPSIKTRR